MADFRDMELLLALARYRHFSQAADEIGISQPAFSARIRKLEESFGTPIVRRGNKFLGFTREGEVMVKWARKILADNEGMRQEVEVSKGDLRGKLIVGAVPTALPVAAQAAANLRAQHPNLAMEIHSLSSRQIAKQLNDYTLDAGITYVDEDVIPGDMMTPLYEETYVLIAPRAIAPRPSGSATWAEAAALPLCLLTRNMRNRQFIDEAFAAVGCFPDPVMETNGFTAALVQVAGGGAAEIAPKGLAEVVFAGLDTVRLSLVDPVLSHGIGLAFKAQDPVLPALEALDDALRASL